jgi:Cu2+-exporting ATPase
MDNTHPGYGLVRPVSIVLHVGGLRLATEKSVVECLLGARPGVLDVSANPSAQTANVSFDPARTSVADLKRCVEECGYRCAGQSVPKYLCDPMEEPSH